MPTLTPNQAARIADGVYQLLDRNRPPGLSGRLAAKGAYLDCEEWFDVSGSGQFKGESGIPGLTTTSEFGYIAHGKGDFQGETLIAVRGTDLDVDWLTNLNIGLQIGPSGHPVHSGFNRTWKSFAEIIRGNLKGKSPTMIHCIGHSLGGALATLNADYLSYEGAADIRLYTFGSPRTGSMDFSLALSSRVGTANIFRVAHVADPVPMIPLFPFLHVPLAGPTITLHSGSRGLVSVGAHNMLESYIPGVGPSTWEQLIKQMPDAREDELRIESWLQNSSSLMDGLGMGSALLLRMIKKALQWILAKTAYVLLVQFSTKVVVGLTLLDQLAAILASGMAASIEITDYMLKLISAVGKYLGRVFSTAVSMTVGFIRWVLDLLFTSVSQLAVKAISKVNDYVPL